jgi:hypothetical protein
MIRAKDGNGNVSSAMRKNIYLSLLDVKSYRARDVDVSQASLSPPFPLYQSL